MVFSIKKINLNIFSGNIVPDCRGNPAEDVSEFMWTVYVLIEHLKLVNLRNYYKISG